MVCWERKWESWDGPRGGWGVPTTHHPPAAFSVFWVQVLLAGLVVPLLLGATLTYIYRRCQPRKPMVPVDGAGMEALTPQQVRISVMFCKRVSKHLGLSLLELRGWALL